MFIMSKKELFKTLNKRQREAVENLIDTAYCHGYDDGRTEERIVYEYDRL